MYFILINYRKRNMSSTTDVVMMDSGELLIIEDNEFSYKMDLVEAYVTIC